MSITTMSMKSAVMSITTVMGNAAVMTIAMSITMRTRYLPAGERMTRISTRRRTGLHAEGIIGDGVYGTVLRSKGIIQMSDGSWRQFDLVPQEYEVREGQPDYTGRLCVIGTDLKEEELLVLFHLK